MPRGGWDSKEPPKQDNIYDELKSTQPQKRKGLGFSNGPPRICYLYLIKYLENDSGKPKSIEEAIRIAKEKAAALQQEGAMKRLRPDKLIARFRRKIKLRKPDDFEKDYAKILLSNNGTIRKNIEYENGVRVIVKPPQTEADLSVLIDIEGEDKSSVDKATIMLNGYLFTNGIVPEDAQTIEDEEVEHQNKRSAFDGNSKDITEIIQIPNQMVGMVIGKAGDTVKNIIATTHAHVQVQKDEETPPGAIYRDVTITGDRLAVRDAKEAVMKLVEQKRLEMTNNCASAVGGMGSTKKDFKIPDNKVGLVIGRGGETCKSIMSRTNTTIYIPPMADRDNPEVRSITITGQPAGVQAAFSDIFALVQGQINVSSLMGDDGPSCTVVIPDDKIGLVIGKGGIHIKEIQSIYGVRVVVPPTADSDAEPLMRTLTLFGNPDMMEKAKDLILTNAGMKEATPILPPEYAQYYPQYNMMDMQQQQQQYYSQYYAQCGDINQWKKYYESMGMSLPVEYEKQLEDYENKMKEYQKQLEEYQKSLNSTNPTINENVDKKEDDKIKNENKEEKKE